MNTLMVIAVILLGVMALVLWLGVIIWLPADAAEWIAPRIGRLALRLVSFGRIDRAPTAEWVLGIILLVALLFAVLIIGAELVNAGA